MGADQESGLKLLQQAVLVRSARHSAILEFELARRKIPFVKVGGMKFIDAAHVKDVMAVLRWAENPADLISGCRVLQLLPGVGPVTAAKAFEWLRADDPLSSLKKFKPAANAASGWRALLKLAKRLQQDKTGWPSEFDLVRAWYQPLLEHRYDDAPERVGDLDQLGSIAGTFKSRRAFLTDFTLDPQEASKKKGRAKKAEDDYLTISTVHSAKGKEWKSVFVLNAVDGCLPSSRSETDEEMEEERRLLYVAMTRAKDQLAIIVPRHVHATSNAANLGSRRTQFKPDTILRRFKEVRPSTRRGDEGDRFTGARAGFDLPKRIRELASA